jgi:hypothetical protein
MNSDIRYLQLLEDDLREAAEIERELDAEAAAGAGRGRTGSGPRRLPRRGWNWGTAAAAIVALLVVAGGIGFLTQPKGSQPAAAGGASEPRPVLGIASASHQFGNQPVKRAEGIAPALAGSSPAPTFGATQQGVALDPFDGVGSGSGSAGVRSTVASLAGSQSDLSKIERDGQIGILIPDKTFSKHVAAVSYIATSSGGMVLSSATLNEKTGTFTLRIPASHFEHAMLQLRAMGAVPGAQILYQDSTGQDVTAQFVDLQARLQIVKGTKARLVSLQSKATTTSQILFLGNQIDQVQLQLEQLQGQINYINNQVAESTIKVELREKDAPVTQTANNTVKQPSLGSAWSRSLQGFLRVIGAVIVGLGYLIPLALIALGVWFAVTLVRRRRRAASSTT